MTGGQVEYLEGFGTMARTIKTLTDGAVGVRWPGQYRPIAQGLIHNLLSARDLSGIPEEWLTGREDALLVALGVA